jgi:GNAT superfamily N-acetyltransferase
LTQVPDLLLVARRDRQPAQRRMSLDRRMSPDRRISIDRLDAVGLRTHLDGLSKVLVACVEGGASVSFMQPFPAADASVYWRGLLPGVESGRVLLLAWLEDGWPLGTVQLHLATPPNQAHRADVAKLLVDPAARGRGIGAALLEAVEREARAQGRTLLTLDTITGSAAERLYLAHGWTRVGVIPDYARMPDGPLAPTTIFYRRLDG